jgi:spore coat polysaccharide biosynthesis protein SpsF
LISHQIARVQLATLPALTVMCTTALPADDKLATLGYEAGLEVFRGSALDVPKRLLNAAEQYSVDYLVIIEGDEAFIDATYIDALIRCASQTGADYVKTQGIPIGAWISGVRTTAMRTLCSEVPTEGVDGWGAFFESDGRFRTEIVSTDPQTATLSQTLRLTIDYPEDFQLLQAVYDQLYEPGRVFSLDEVLQLFRREPQLANINRHLVEIYWQRWQQRSL